MKSKKRLIQVSLLGIIIAAMSFTANAETFRASMHTPGSSMHGKYMNRLSAKLKEGTNDKINFEVYESGTLLPAKGILKGLQQRVADFGLFTTAWLPSDTPYDNLLFDLSWFSENQLADTFASVETKLLHPLLQEENKGLGIVFNSEVSMSIYNFQCNTAVKSLADLEKKKIRTTSAAHVAFLEKLGAVGVNVPATEIYTGLQRGSLDCTFATPLFLTDYFQLIDVVKSIYRLPMGSANPGGFYFSGAFWKSLSDDERRLILDLSAETVADVMLEWGQRVDDAWAQVKEKGIVVTEPEEEVVAIHKKFNAEYKKDLANIEHERRGIPLESAAQLINDYTASYAKWVKLLSGIDITNIDEVTALVKKEIYDKVDEKTFGM